MKQWWEREREWSCLLLWSEAGGLHFSRVSINVLSTSHTDSLHIHFSIKPTTNVPKPQMENTRIRPPKSPALPPPPSPGSLVRSKSRSSAAITLPENNSCAANTSQRSIIHRSKSMTKSRTKNKDEENLNPLNCKTKAGFTKFLKSSPGTSPSAWALSPGRSLGSHLVLSPLTAVEPAVADKRRGKLGGQRGGGVSGVLRFFRPKKAAVMAEAEELHRFRILQNRLLQWKYVNVRAETSMANVKTLVQVLLDFFTFYFEILSITFYHLSLNYKLPIMVRLLFDFYNFIFEN